MVQSRLCQCSSVAAIQAMDVEHSAGLEKMQRAVVTLLEGLGEDTEREGLRDTPRVSFGIWLSRREDRTTSGVPVQEAPTASLLSACCGCGPLFPPFLQRVAKAWLDMAGGSAIECKR